MEDALRGAAHRAAPRRVACLGRRPRDFERALADALDPAIASAEIASELRANPSMSARRTVNRGQGVGAAQVVGWRRSRA